MSWKIKTCTKCGVSGHMHAARKVCVPCRIAQENSPEAIRQRDARRQSTRAIKSGKLVRRPCVACTLSGNEQRGISHGHHEDYSKPLDLIWLCAMHHRWTHKYGLADVLSRSARTAA